MVSPKRTGAGRRTSSRPSQATTESPNAPVWVTRPSASASVSGPWAMRSPKGVAAAYSASVCSGTQSPVSDAQFTTWVSVTVSPAETDAVADREALPRPLDQRHAATAAPARTR